MPIQNVQGLPPSESGDSVPRVVLRPRDQYKQVIALVRRYVVGRGRLNRETVENHPHFHTLTESEWYSALPRERSNGRLIYCEPSKLENVADPTVDPFSTVYQRQLLDLIESNLLTEDLPYFHAFVENQKPRELAFELGIKPKAASRRMKEVRGKVQQILKQVRRQVSCP